MGYVSLFFFFKQKTAYEMRISDWSSDVCSSDLRLQHRRRRRFGREQLQRVGPGRQCRERLRRRREARHRQQAGVLGGADHAGVGMRSEEHTSELQSLMRISYAVFCLKKNNNTAAYHATPLSRHLLQNQQILIILSTQQ